MTSPSKDLFGEEIDDDERAPAWLAAKIERRARSIRGCCLPQLCLEFSGGDAATIAAMDRGDAEAMNEALGLMVAMEIKEPGVMRRRWIEQAEQLSAAEPRRPKRYGHGRPDRSAGG
jgi:hypothetical protein